MFEKIQFSSLDQGLDWLLSARWEKSKPGLSRTFDLLSRYDHPQRDLTYIHLAGTNGKGSTALMINQIYLEAGYKVGLYLSPEINRFNERIRINGRPIPDDDLLDLINSLVPRSAAMEDKPSQFEMLTAIALLYFRRQACDLVILETGMGGRLDSTNVIPPPLLSLITPIGLDHTRYLGDRLTDIAGEKGGIIKEGSRCILTPQEEEADRVLTRICKDRNVPLIKVSEDRIHDLGFDGDRQSFSYTCSNGRHYEKLELRLLGRYQQINAAAALEAVLSLEEDFPVAEDHIRAGLRSAINEGRFEILQKNPLWIADVAHNPQGTKKLLESIVHYFPDRKVHLLVGVFADKDYRTMLKILSTITRSYSCISPPSARALPAEELAAYIRTIDPTAEVAAYSSPEEAVTALMAEDRRQDDAILYLVTGSLSFMGKVRSLFLDR